METSQTIHEFRATGPLEEVEIHWVSGGVTLGLSENNEIYAQQKGARALPEGERMRSYFENGRLLIEIPERRQWGWVRTTRPERTFLYLYLPKNSLRRLVIKGISNWVAGNWVDAQELSISMVSGDVRLEGNMRSVESSFVSGNLNLTFSSLPSMIRFRNVSGNGILRLPKNDGVHLTQTMLSGRVNCVFPVLSGFGDGKPEIQISGVSSNIRIERG